MHWPVSAFMATISHRRRTNADIFQYKINNLFMMYHNLESSAISICIRLDKITYHMVFIYCSCMAMCFQTLLNSLKYEDPKVREVVHVLTQLFDEHPMFTRPVKDLIWGYADPMLNIAKAIDPNWFYTDVVGYFINVIITIV